MENKKTLKNVKRDKNKKRKNVFLHLWRSHGGISVYIPSQNQSLKIILCTNCSRCRQAASI